MRVRRVRKEGFLEIADRDSVGYGMCQRSGMLFALNRLWREKQWFGNELRPNGLLVADINMDEPSEQLRPPKPRMDPKPIPVMSPMQGYAEVGTNVIPDSYEERVKLIVDGSPPNLQNK